MPKRKNKTIKLKLKKDKVPYVMDDIDLAFWNLLDCYEPVDGKCQSAPLPTSTNSSHQEDEEEEEKCKSESQVSESKMEKVTGLFKKVRINDGEVQELPKE